MYCLQKRRGQEYKSGETVLISLISLETSSVPPKIKDKAFLFFAPLASVFARASLGGTLEVIDYDRQRVILSNDKYGCTGYSASLANSKEMTVQVGN